MEMPPFLLLGFVCECGLRAGYFEVVNMDPDVKSVLTASVAANLCPTVLGQVSFLSTKSEVNLVEKAIIQWEEKSTPVAF